MKKSQVDVESPNVERLPGDEDVETVESTRHGKHQTHESVASVIDRIDRKADAAKKPPVHRKV